MKRGENVPKDSQPDNKRARIKRLMVRHLLPERTNRRIKMLKGNQFLITMYDWRLNDG